VAFVGTGTGLEDDGELLHLRVSFRMW